MTQTNQALVQTFAIGGISMENPLLVQLGLVPSTEEMNQSIVDSFVGFERWLGELDWNRMSPHALPPGSEIPGNPPNLEGTPYPIDPTVGPDDGLTSRFSGIGVHASGTGATTNIGATNAVPSSNPPLNGSSSPEPSIGETPEGHVAQDLIDILIGGGGQPYFSHDELRGMTWEQIKADALHRGFREETGGHKVDFIYEMKPGDLNQELQELPNIPPVPLKYSWSFAFDLYPLDPTKHGPKGSLVLESGGGSQVLSENDGEIRLSTYGGDRVQSMYWTVHGPLHDTGLQTLPEAAIEVVFQSWIRSPSTPKAIPSEKARGAIKKAIDPQVEKTVLSAWASRFKNVDGRLVVDMEPLSNEQKLDGFASGVNDYQFVASEYRPSKGWESATYRAPDGMTQLKLASNADRYAMVVTDKAGKVLAWKEFTLAQLKP